MIGRSVLVWRQKIPLVIALLLSTTTNQISLVEASSSTYAVYDYDTSHSIFTPDGRVLQVEYASRAAASASGIPLFVVPLGDADVTSNQAKTSTKTAFSSSVAVITYRPVSRTQQRLLVFGEGNNKVLIALSGVLADCAALLRQVQGSLQQQQPHLFPTSNFPKRRRRGSTAGTAAAAASAWAGVAAAQCANHAIGGGIRPYGASLLLVCPAGNERRVQLIRTDPSGAVEHLPVPLFREAGPNHRVRIVGDRHEQARALQRVLESALAEEEESSNTAKQMDDTVIRKQRKNRLTRLLSIVQKHLNDRVSGDGIKEAGSGDLEKEGFVLEVALVSSKHGVYKLTPTEIERILSS